MSTDNKTADELFKEAEDFTKSIFGLIHMGCALDEESEQGILGFYAKAYDALEKEMMDKLYATDKAGALWATASKEKRAKLEKANKMIDTLIKIYGCQKVDLAQDIVADLYEIKSEISLDEVPSE